MNLDKNQRSIIGAALEVLQDEFMRDELTGAQFVAPQDLYTLLLAIAILNDPDLNWAAGCLWDKESPGGGWLLSGAVSAMIREFSSLSPLPGEWWYEQVQCNIMGEVYCGPGF